MSTVPHNQGDIVYLSLVDPAGRNRKVRPAVLVTLTAGLTTGGRAVVVAVTTQVGNDPVVFVELPWDAAGYPRTRFKQRCAAKCDWLDSVPVGDLPPADGHVPGVPLAMILSRLGITRIPPVPRAPTPPAGAG